MTLLFRRLASEPAKEAVKLLREMVQRGRLRLERIGPDRFKKTIELRLKFFDKPNISFSDLSSMVVMEELGIRSIITADARFRHVGKDFQVVPQ